MQNWFSSSLGQETLKNEKLRCEQLLPGGYYPCSLQVGLPDISFAENVSTEHHFLADRSLPSESLESGVKPHVVSRAGSLPFAEKSMNLIYLPHTLDYCNDPHEVLREVNQILVPEGCVVMTGFNTLSMWGGLKSIRPTRWRHEGSPYAGRYYSVRRMQDWLSLLGFDIVGAQMMCYQPPLQNELWRQRMTFLDNMGNRWWPGFGSVYAIVGRKREMAVSSGHRQPMRWKQLIPGLAQPATQSAAKNAAKAHLRVVPK